MEQEKVLNLIKVLRNVLSSSSNNDVDNVEVFEEALMDVVGGGGGGNEPLIVEGTEDDGVFYPNVGEPTKEEAFDAIGEGRVVIIRVLGEEEGTYTLLPWRESNPGDGYIVFTNNLVW